MSIALKYIHTDGDVRSNIYLIFNTYLDVSDNVDVVGTAIDCLFLEVGGSISARTKMLHHYISAPRALPLRNSARISVMSIKRERRELATQSSISKFKK